MSRKLRLADGDASLGGHAQIGRERTSVEAQSFDGWEFANEVCSKEIWYGVAVGLVTIAGVGFGALVIAGVALGQTAFGGVAIGHYAKGGATIGAHVVSSERTDHSAAVWFGRLGLHPSEASQPSEPPMKNLAN